MKWGWHGLDICLDLCQRSSGRGTAWTEHSHEFYEVFWIDEGYCIHRLNGQDSRLGKGDIVFLNPGDKHSGEAVKSDILIYTNLSLEKNTLERIKSHYYIPEEQWPWSDNSRKLFTLSPKQIMALKNMRETIDCSSELDHDLFVLQLLKFLKEPMENNLVSLPSWLQQSLKDMHNRREYSLGVAGLAEISGYSREHISRLIRKGLNKSATELLNEMRFEGVLNLLRHTDRTILQISEEFDFQSTAYFHKSFKERFNQTPRKYREWHRSLMAERDGYYRTD